MPPAHRSSASHLRFRFEDAREWARSHGPSVTERQRPLRRVCGGACGAGRHGCALRVVCELRDAVLMSEAIERNKSLIVRFNEEVFNDHRVDAVDRFLAEDHFNEVSGASGVEDFKRIVRYILDFAPDSRSQIDSVVAEGDEVVVFLTWTGTHRGDVQMAGRSFPPTGARFSVHQVHRYRVVDERIVEHAAVRDDLSLLRQLEDAAGDTPIQAAQ